MSAAEQVGGFAGLCVVAFESRRAQAMAELISSHGGMPLVAPSMREVPIEDNQNAFEFAGELFAGRIDMVIFLTGVGARFLTRVIETRHSREEWVKALSRVVRVARGPKPVAALKELGLPAQVAVPEPNTWRDLLASLDQGKAGIPLSGCRVALQEYGVSNPELIEGLRARGAAVMRVPVYQWALPLEREPLCKAIEAIAGGKVDVALFTTSVQVIHVAQVAAEMGLREALARAWSRTVIASIGPTTSETLREQGWGVDLEAGHPRMGVLVHDAAGQSRRLLTAKRKHPAE